MDWYAKGFSQAGFEKYYGEGCFSCPGQVYETVEQTAARHNVDPENILQEINAVIGSWDFHDTRFV